MSKLSTIVMKRLAALCLLFAFSPVHATDYFACDCAAGADAQCIAGDDNASGTSVDTPWRSYARARNAWAGLAAGDAIRFCEGGVFEIAGSTRWVNSNCTDAARCTIGAYSSPWGGGDESRPVLRQASGAGFDLGNGGGPVHEEGYVIEDLELVCTACERTHPGVFFFNDVDHVTMRRLGINGFGIGVYVSGSNPCPGGGTCDRGSAGIQLRDSVVRDSLYHGFLGGGDDLVIADTLFERNGTGTVLEHNVYIVGTFSRVHFVRNTLRRSAAAATGRCEGASIVSHGYIEDFLLEGNLIEEPLGGAAGGCWGINLSPGNESAEAFIRATVRGNTIRNTGTAGIALAACIDCVVENNVIVHAQPHAIVAISAPVASFGDTDATLTGLIVRNNSIHIATTNSVGIRVDTEGSDHVVVGNSIESTATSGFWSCLSLNLPASAYAAVDHNVCGYVPGAQREWEFQSGTLAQWRMATGLDGESLAAAPGYRAPGAPTYDLTALSATSAMVGQGDSLHGAPNDFHGMPRGTSPDAGAFQFVSGDAVFSHGFE